MPVHGALDERKRQRRGTESCGGGTTHSSHPVCGASHTDIGDHTDANCEKNITWTAWDGTSDITYDKNTNTAYVYLTDNVERTSPLTVSNGQTLYLCLNGHSITKKTETQWFDGVITVLDGAQFILCDCKDGGKITHATDKIGRGVRVGTSSGSATFNMYGGSISGNRLQGKDGAGVELHQATFNMYGGTISDNHHEGSSNYGGGGVCAHTSSRFIMYGGTISNNRSSEDGGGMILWGGSLEIHGGTISGNTAKNNGGGIYTNCTLTISGNSKIINNTATDGSGGGVYMRGSLTLSDAACIQGNHADKGSGGGVYMQDGNRFAITSSNAAITNNSSANGGGVYLDTSSTFNIASGSITNNTVTANGGGVYFAGSAFNISGSADISENVKGGTISNGNLSGGTANNIYLPNGKTITISRELTSTTPIGVTTEAKPDASSYVTIASGSTNYVHPDNFQYENDTTPISVITNGNKATLVACKHNLGEDWSTDDSNHWHTCSICNGKGGTATHNYDQKVVAEAYLMTSATCTSPATYYNSCVCGQKGTETFESGEKDASKHTGFLSDWQSDDKNHWKAYSCCNAHAETAAHTPGAAATATTPQTCTACGYVIKAATGTTTTSGGSGYTPSPSPGKNDSNQSASTSVTVPVSGEDKSVQIDAAVSGTTATIENVYTSKLDTVIGNDVKVGTVTIDFSGLNKEVNAAKLPADVVARIAAAANDPNNDTENLKIVFTDNTSIVLDAKALGAKSAQGTAADLTISIKSTTNSSLNTKQQKAVGSRPALDINLTSAGKQISDMGGEITISAPYRLHTGEKSRGIVVYYVNEQGKKMRCETSYDPAAKQVSWKTDHLSVYMIGYDKSKVTPAKKPTTGKNTTAAVTYTVKRGDTLHAIARKYNTRVSKIVAANSKRIKNPNLIYSGWKLKIPQNQRKS